MSRFADIFSVKEYAEYSFFRILLSFSKLFPKKILYRIIKFFVTGHYRDSKKHGIIKKQIESAFPEKTKKDIGFIAAAHIEHIALLAYEVVLMLTGRLDYMKAIENFEEAIGKLEKLKDRSSNKGLLLMTGHYGNWEIAGQFLAQNGIDLILITKELKNRYITEKILIPFRTKDGHRSIPREKSMIAIAKEMKKGGVSGLLIDQMIPPPNGIEIEFFGQKAYTTKSIAQLKLKFDPLVVFLFPVRVGMEKFRIEIGEPIEYRTEELAEKEDKIVALTQHYTNILEQRVRKVPEQWQWSYQRWRRP